MFMITKKLIYKYCWTVIKDEENNVSYHFTDWDYATVDHSGEKTRREKRIELERPRFSIFWKIELKNTKKKARSHLVTLDFDDEARLIETDIPKNVSKEQVNKSIEWLIENGYLEGSGVL